MSISIREYTPSDAEAVARMWNESGKGWPDGWSRVPTSDDYWLDELGQLDPLAIYLAVEDDTVVAYCELNEDSERGDVAWLDLVNVHPSAWNRGVGRDLVRRAVDLAVARRYRKLDLSTWSGNFRAVPLCKKCGFFWRPDTAVRMENYLPLLHTFAQCAAFFSRHDWYKTLRRSLAVVPDDETRGNVRGYSYHWEAEARSLPSSSIASSTVLPRWRRMGSPWGCRSTARFLIAGRQGTAYVTLTNKEQGPLDALIVARGIGLEGGVESRLALAETAHIQIPVRAVSVSTGIVPYVEAVIALDDQFVTLRGSIPILPAISVATIPTPSASHPVFRSRSGCCSPTTWKNRDAAGRRAAC